MRGPSALSASRKRITAAAFFGTGACRSGFTTARFDVSSCETRIQVEVNASAMLGVLCGSSLLRVKLNSCVSEA
jgi:hypothetical protein